MSIMKAVTRFTDLPSCNDGAALAFLKRLTNFYHYEDCHMKI